MKKPIYLILTLVLIILVVIITLQNTKEVSISLLFWKLYIPLAILIFAMFALGAIAAILIISPSIIRPKLPMSKEKEERY